MAEDAAAAFSGGSGDRGGDGNETVGRICHLPNE